jgi:hypothetical protein
MSLQAWLFVWLAVMALVRLIQSRSMDPLRPAPPPPRRSQPKPAAPPPPARYSFQNKRPFISCYLRKGLVFLPTYGRHPDGFYCQVEPVAVIAVAETDALREAMKDAMKRGHPALPGGKQADKLLLPTLAGVKSYSAFDKACTGSWALAEWGTGYVIETYKSSPKRLGWTKDPRDKIFIRPGTDIAGACDRLIGLLQAAAAGRPLEPQRYAGSVSCYLQRDTVYVPTFGTDPDGRRKMIEPLAIAPLGKSDALHRAIKDAILLGSPPLPLLDRRESILALPRLPQLAAVGTWQAFYDDVLIWDIEAIEGAYGIFPKRRDPSSRRWVRDATDAIILPSETDLDTVCTRIIEVIRAAASNRPPRPLSPAEALQAELDADPWVTFEDDDRIGELGDFLEWIANARPEDAPTIEGEIKRYYYDNGDKDGGDALNQALREALVATDLAERAAILDRYERYTQEDWVKAHWAEQR